MSVSFILVFISAFLFYLSFPNIIFYQGCPALTWLCLVPLFFALHQRSIVERLQLGMVFGFISYALLVQWLAPISVFGFLLFVFVLMIQPVLFCLLSFIDLRSSWLNAIAMGVLWVGLEYMRSLLFDGFVWGLGYSQALWPAMIQVAAWSGVYGVSFLIVVVNYLLFSTLITRGARRSYGIVAVMLFVAVVFAGLLNMMMFKPKPTSEHIIVGVTQANIDPKQKLDLEQYDHNVMEHMRLTKNAAMEKTDLVVWPETALVDDYVQDNKWRRLIQKMIRNMKTHLLIGSATLEHNQDYNSAILINKKGRIEDVYHKKFLVPFTEYIPQRSPFNLFHDKLNLTGFRFQSGNNFGFMTILNKNQQPVTFGLAICSETGYPVLYRALRLGGAAFAVSMLNDGWFQQKAALVMHLHQDIFRAVEHRLPIVRSANTGVSTLIQASGQIHRQDMLPPMTRTHGVFQVPIQQYPLTQYIIVGDVFAQWSMMASLFLVVFSLLWGFVPKKEQVVH